MTTSSTSTTTTSGTDPGIALRGLRILALLSTLNVLCQGATAGQVLMRSQEAFELHETGAVVLHLLTGLATVAAALLWRQTRGSIWPTALAAVLFVVSFLQAATGHGRTLYIHVPLALILLVGAVWLLSWAWLRPMPSPRS